MNDRVYVTFDEIQAPSCDIDSQETVISWTRRDNLATISTSDPTMVTKLKNIMKDNPSYQCWHYKNNIDSETGRPFAYEFSCDKSLISFRKKASERQLTDEARQQIARRLKKK